KQMLSSIDYNFSLDKDWQDFQKIYEQVHQDFFDSLQRQFPDLTAGEIRLCALMRLNLNSQDIAAVLGISSDSLRTTRYRLRKKMNLPKGRNLASHIMSL
ncbi:MAG: helix-turn-helix transcriptional regulator, partial [Bacteroidota bacterium]